MNRYNDIIDMPYKPLTKRKHMTLYERAAQFAPFAALTGFDAIIDKQARFTDARPVLCDDDAAELDRRFNELFECLDEQPLVTLTYFVKDKYKEGGCLKEKTGVIRLIDAVSRQFIFYDKQVIAIDDVVNVCIKKQTG